MRDLGVVIILGLSVMACGDDGMPIGDEPDASTGSASVTMQVVNGATPNAAARPTHGPAHATDGNWQISPDELHTILVGLEIYSTNAGTLILDLDDCGVDFNIGDPGLAQHVDCPFELPAGEYVAITPIYENTFRALIYDIPNGIYTDPESPTLLSTSADGVDEVTLELEGIEGPFPDSVKGTGGALFDPPLVVNDGDQLTLTLLLNALQDLQLNVNGSTLTFGADANGHPGFPDAVISVGTPARVSFYVNDLLGTALSAGPGDLPSDELAHVSVLHGADDQPVFLDLGGAANLTFCPSQAQFFFGGEGNGYLGLDSNGWIGWAGMNGTDYTSLWRLPAIANLNVTGTAECAGTDTDPNPPGDTFETGAPQFTPQRTFDMTLLAK